MELLRGDSRGLTQGTKASEIASLLREDSHLPASSIDRLVLIRWTTTQ